MSAGRTLLIATSVLGVAAISDPAPSRAIDFTGGTCKPREAVELAKRDPYEEAALRFVSNIEQAKFLEAEGDLTSELRKYVPVDHLAATIQPNTEIFKSLGPLRVTHSYLVETNFMTGKNQKVICVAKPDVATSSPYNIVFVTAQPVPEQSHVIIEGDAPKGTWTFSLWMVPERDAWRVQGFHMAPPSALDMTVTQVFNLAREQRQKGHSLNAAIIYAAASQMADRGKDFQLGIRGEIEQGISGVATAR